MNTLIAITSYEKARQAGWHEAIRQTWLKDLDPTKADVAFIVGRDAVGGLDSDELRLDVGDGYTDVTNKVIESTRWALNQGYDRIFRTYPDVYIRPERLLAALENDYADKSYIGHPMMGLNGVPYASGGASYWIGAQESKYLLNTMVPYDWADDRWVGNVMRTNGVTLWSDFRYSPIARPPLLRNDNITSHLSRPNEDGKPGTYNPQWMYNTHKFWTLSQGV
jgi:hypothetical protein